jgi:hypothetical protein
MALPTAADLVRQQVYLGWRQSTFEVVDLLPSPTQPALFSDVCSRLVARLQLPTSIIKR